MVPKGFAIGVADERGTIDDLSGALLGGNEILHFREESEPAAEGLLVGRIVEPDRVWRAQNQDNADSGNGSGHFFRAGAAREDNCTTVAAAS